MRNHKTISFSLEISLIEELQKRKGDVPISIYVNNLLKRAIKVKGGKRK